MGHGQLSAGRCLAATALCLVVALAACGGGGQKIQALPGSICSPVAQGEDAPEVLVVSDLPLRGVFRPTTTQMVRAIRDAIERRGFRAGDHALGYQSCDDSSAEEGNFTPGRCAANMREFAGNTKVVGVIGPFNSQCAQFEIPIANRALQGPLAMISPSNTGTGLTRAGPGTAAGEPGRYYPTGARNYVRIVASDEAQAAVLALVARDAGARRLFVLDDGDEGYGAPLARSVRAAVTRTRLQLAGSARYDPRGRSFGHIARRVKRSGADAVAIVGLWQAGGTAVVEDLRAALGERVRLLAPDGFASLPAREAAGAQGLLVMAPGLPPERLRPNGKEIVRRFGAGQLPGLGPPYAAQAAEVLLDAIAASDGNRASVTRRLLAAQVDGSVLGPIDFDTNGDIAAKSVSVYRVTRDGLALRDVVTAPNR